MQVEKRTGKTRTRKKGKKAGHLLDTNPRIVDFFQVTSVNSTSEGHCLPHGQVILSSRIQTSNHVKNQLTAYLAYSWMESSQLL